MDSPEQNMQEFVSRMAEIGMAENEAKAYYAVFMLKSVTVRDVFELSGIPRNKIYQVLEGLLEKGFVQRIDARPIRYAAVNAKEVFDRLRKEAVERYSSAEEYLRSFSVREPVDIRPQVYEIQSDWAIENHINLLLRRTKQELILLVNNTDYLSERIPDTVFKRLAKKLDIYPVILTPQWTAELPVPCYRIRRESVQFLEKERTAHPFITDNTDLILVSDRKNGLIITKSEGNRFASMLYLDDNYTVLTNMFAIVLQTLVPLSPHL